TLKPQEIMMSPEGDDALNAKLRLGNHPSEKNRGFPTACVYAGFRQFSGIFSAQGVLAGSGTVLRTRREERNQEHGAEED
ncbi:hypothetical protein M5W89_03300, partial [Paenibacillus thiaminolyticus]